MKSSETEVFEKICEEVGREGYLKGRHVLQLSGMFGKRVQRALKAIREGRVKKYVFRPSQKALWVLTGYESDYHLIPIADFCTCDDFFFRVVNGETPLCYHLISQKLANALGKYELIEEEDKQYARLMREWKTKSG
jgi:predicted nucleic acid-binding Zn finger protein